MKCQSISKILLIGALFCLVAMPVFAESSKTASNPRNFFVRIKQEITITFKNIGQFFRGSKDKTVQNTRNTKQNIKKDCKDTKTKAVQDAKEANQSVKKTFKGRTNKVKQDAKTVKQKFVNGFKSLKND